MRDQGETRELTVALTDKELQDRGDDLAAAVARADDQERYLEGRKKAWRDEKRELEAELERLRKEGSALAEIVRTGKERRDVGCTWKYALSAGWAFLVRDDTGEQIQARQLKDDERQLTLGEPPYAEPTPEELEEWLKRQQGRR